MATQVRWIVSASASCYHAVSALFDGRTLLDQALANALAEPAAILQQQLASHGVPWLTLRKHLLPLAAEIDSDRQLAQMALTKALGPGEAERMAPALAASLSTLEAAYARARPDALNELELRSGPLRQQWEARGPGLLATVGRLTERELLPSQADVVLVQPVLGGYGESHHAYNRVTLEAVLANPHEQLPEVVRLGWLLSQLQLDLPRYSERLATARRLALFGQAMCPPSLAAAAEVELGGGIDRLGEALAAWHVEPAAADTLRTWWQTYAESRPTWPAALQALEAMLGSAECGMRNAE